jgi:hypothetical protein
MNDRLNSMLAAAACAEAFAAALRDVVKKGGRGTRRLSLANGLKIELRAILEGDAIDVGPEARPSADTLRHLRNGLREAKDATLALETISATSPEAAEFFNDRLHQARQDVARRERELVDFAGPSAIPTD